MHYNKNAGKPWIRQRFFRQCLKIKISPKFCTAKVLFYMVSSNENKGLQSIAKIRSCVVKLLITESRYNTGYIMLKSFYTCTMDNRMISRSLWRKLLLISYNSFRKQIF